MSKRLRDRYALNQSPLFRIRGKGQFESIIGIEWDAVKALVLASPYRVWLNAKGREIQQPRQGVQIGADVRRRWQ